MSTNRNGNVASYRPYGKVTELAQQYQVTRQTLYVIRNKGQAVLMNGLEPGPHGARIKEKRVQINRARVERSTVVLTQHGVSQRISRPVWKLCWKRAHRRAE